MAWRIFVWSAGQRTGLRTSPVTNIPGFKSSSILLSVLESAWQPAPRYRGPSNILRRQRAFESLVVMPPRLDSGQRKRDHASGADDDLTIELGLIDRDRSCRQAASRHCPVRTRTRTPKPGQCASSHPFSSRRPRSRDMIDALGSAVSAPLWQTTSAESSRSPRSDRRLLTGLTILAVWHLHITHGVLRLTLQRSNVSISILYRYWRGRLGTVAT